MDGEHFWGGLVTAFIVLFWSIYRCARKPKRTKDTPRSDRGGHFDSIIKNHRALMLSLNDFGDATILLVGPPGAGKSSLINLIASACEPVGDREDLRPDEIAKALDSPNTEGLEIAILRGSGTTVVKKYHIRPLNAKQTITLIDTPGLKDDEGDSWVKLFHSFVWGIITGNIRLNFSLHYGPSMNWLFRSYKPHVILYCHSSEADINLPFFNFVRFIGEAQGSKVVFVATKAQSFSFKRDQLDITHPQFDIVEIENYTEADNKSRNYEKEASAMELVYNCLRHPIKLESRYVAESQANERWNAVKILTATNCEWIANRESFNLPSTGLIQNGINFGYVKYLKGSKVVGATIEGQHGFEKSLKESLSKNNKGVIVHVHGYCTTPKDAYDWTFHSLNMYQGFAVVAFVWPSLGKVSEYHSDVTQADMSVESFRQLLSVIKGVVGSDGEVIVFAHSMGSLIAFASLAFKTECRPSRVFFVASDISVTEVEARASQLAETPGPCVIFCSDQDVALVISKKIHEGQQRLGQASEVSGFKNTIIIICKVSTDIFRHSYYTQNMVTKITKCLLTRNAVSILDTTFPALEVLKKDNECFIYKE